MLKKCSTFALDFNSAQKYYKYLTYANFYKFFIKYEQKKSHQRSGSDSNRRCIGSHGHLLLAQDGLYWMEFGRRHRVELNIPRSLVGMRRRIY